MKSDLNDHELIADPDLIGTWIKGWTVARETSPPVATDAATIDRLAAAIIVAWRIVKDPR